MTQFKPMLASPADLDKVRFPVLASPKIDGIRGVVLDRGEGPQLLTRKLLTLPNKHVFATLSNTELLGLDGELVVGRANAPDVMRATTSGLMRHEGEPDYTFWVFDHVYTDGGYDKRLAALEKKVSLYVKNTFRVSLLPQKLIETHDALLSFEAQIVEGGYEGVIIRDPKGPYKHGRSTANEGYLLKVKRFQDSEAEIIGFEEEMENTNEATRDELGRTKRSSAKAGKVGKGTLGAFICRDLGSGIEFNVGTGISAADRAQFWIGRDALASKIVKYRFFPVGVKEAPRHPAFIGFRDPRDMS